MAVSFELPRDIETSLRRKVPNLDRAAKEAALIDLYRQHKLMHHELSQALGISRFETDALLKEHDVNYEISLEDIHLESESLRPTRP